MPGIYSNVDAPPGVVTLEQAENWARGIILAKEHKFSRCLVFSRRLSVWID
ncbi:MAG: hypothetical protein ABIT01_11090 [Thermoanaerobaculia bacterium]